MNDPEKSDFHYGLQEMEKALGVILADLHLLNRLCNLLLEMMVGERQGSDDISFYFHICRTVHRLQKEAFRQSLLLLSMKSRFFYTPAERRTPPFPGSSCGQEHNIACSAMSARGG